MSASCWFRHDWGRWEQYKWEGTVIAGRVAPSNVQGQRIEMSELRQKRVCQKCGKMQDELVRIG